MDLNEFSQVFFAEAEELLSDMEQHLLRLDIARPATEPLNAIFRAAHSLKGGAATFGFSVLQETTHLLENLLDKARCGEIQLNRDMINLFLEGKDIMQAQLEAYQSSQEPDEECFRYICSALQQIALAENAERPQAAAPPAANVPTDSARLAVTLSEIKAQEQTLLLAELANLGRVISHRSVGSGIEVELETTALAGEISAVLCFVLDEAQIAIRPLTDISPPPASAPAAVVPEEVNTRAKPGMAQRPSGTESGSLRVAVEKVDKIINQVGELIITQSIFSQLTGQLDPAKYGMLLSSVAQLERNARELQQSVMSIRMMPMDYVFSRFPRLVHDLGARLNKDVALTLLGGAAELDKSLIERIIDPLTHLVRNSLDHGIEEKEERLRKGKSVTGNLTLSAEHHGGNIVIEVTDDGAGLNREKLLAKARSRGTQIADSASDDEVWMLIFAAGFSTANNVTDLSGRGVGMDVVRRNILAMGGHVEVCSVRDQGTTIRILLPLTLAILDGMSVRVGEEIYVLPLNVVIESLRPSADMLYQFVGQTRVVQVRGEYLPLTELRQAFEVRGEASTEEGIIVIVQSGGCRYALWVDQLVGQHQVVVKNLEHNYRKVPGISAATILGDGSVALILDVIELASLSRQTGSAEGNRS